MARCLHCAADGLSAAFDDWFCFVCGKRSSAKAVNDAEVGVDSTPPAPPSEAPVEAPPAAPVEASATGVTGTANLNLT